MADLHREACRKEHRLIGHYLAVQAWINGLDCIVLERDDLEVLFDLQKFKDIRVEWIKEDLMPWFSGFRAFYYSGKSPSTLYLSRINMSPYLPKGAMTTDNRIEKLSPKAPKTALFSSAIKATLDKKRKQLKDAMTIRLYYCLLGKKVLMDVIDSWSLGFGFTENESTNIIIPAKHKITKKHLAHFVDVYAKCIADNIMDLSRIKNSPDKIQYILDEFKPRFLELEYNGMPSKKKIISFLAFLNAGIIDPSEDEVVP